MGTYRSFRTEFLMHASRIGLNDYQARRLCRLATTHNRLAEAECNGDWPCDNGERKVVWCDRCGSGYVRSHTYLAPKEFLTGHSEPASGRICQSCRTEDNIRKLCRAYGIGVEFQGDPRGWTVTLRQMTEAERYPVQYTPETCPGRPCGTECDHRGATV